MASDFEAIRVLLREGAPNLEPAAFADNTASHAYETADVVTALVVLFSTRKVTILYIILCTVAISSTQIPFHEDPRTIYNRNGVNLGGIHCFKVLLVAMRTPRVH